MKPYEYDIGDRVHMSYEYTERDGTVIRLLPSGGGSKGRDPLYLVLFDEPIPVGTSGFEGLTQKRDQAEIHSEFLRLISKHVEEDDSFSDIENLL